MRFLSGLLALLLPLIVAAPLRAAEEIEVRTFSVNLRNGTFELNVRASFPADEEVRSALAAGVTINLRLQAVVDEKHSYWFDERVADLKFERELSWNVLSQRFVLRYDLKEGELGRQQSFTTLEQALVAAGTVEGWPVIAQSKLEPDTGYQLSVRASLRRGRMPSTLRELTFWTRYWNHRSEWQTWALHR